MSFKKILALVFMIVAFFSSAVVYSNYYKLSNVKLYDVLGKNIYLDSTNLNSTIVVFSSESDISSYKIHSNCNVSSEFLKNLKNYYFFSITFDDKNCSNWNFYLEDGDKIFSNTNFTLNILRDFDLLNGYTDYSSIYLNKLREYFSAKEEKYEIFSSLSWEFNYDLSKKNRYFNEIIYKDKVVENIINSRSTKYKIPVSGYELPTLKTKLPNSPRPYRANYTDWIHEWWDIDAPAWTDVISMDDGIILKVVNNFKFSDLDKLKKDWNMTLNDRITNLDILRWNQVWLKTMKWDLVFYWHLNEVYDNVKVWDIVKKWTPFWTVWKTWVPDKDYTDYHLHFEVRRNPYNEKNAWNYSFLDYMKWDWYFKWQTAEFIKENQYNIFEE